MVDSVDFWSFILNELSGLACFYLYREAFWMNEWENTEVRNSVYVCVCLFVYIGIGHLVGY
jgi:hypothetical protein